MKALMVHEKNWQPYIDICDNDNKENNPALYIEWTNDLGEYELRIEVTELSENAVNDLEELYYDNLVSIGDKYEPLNDFEYLILWK
jgi:hypothetical protein